MSQYRVSSNKKSEKEWAPKNFCGALIVQGVLSSLEGKGVFPPFSPDRAKFTIGDYMPLSSGCSVSALRNNIRELISKGMPRDQAVATAFSQLKTACKSRGKPIPDTGEIVKGFEEDLCEAVSEFLSAADSSDRGLRDTDVWGNFNYSKDKD